MSKSGKINIADADADADAADRGLDGGSPAAGPTFAWQSLVLRHAQRLLHATGEDLDDRLNQLLAEVGTLAEADRSYLFLLTEEGDATSNTHEWCRPGVSSEKDNLQHTPNSQLPWWFEQMRSKRPIFLRSLDDLPPEAMAERAILEPQGIQALAAIPVWSNEQLLGFFGFDSVRSPRSWSEDDLRLLELVAEVLGGVVWRHQHAAELSREVLRQRRRGDAIENRFRTIFAGSRHFICYVDPAGRVREVNPAASAFGPVTGSEADGPLFWEACWWRHDPGLQARWRGILAEAAAGSVVNLRCALPGAGGERTLDFSISLVTGPDGVPEGMIVEGRDITEIESTRAALESAEQRWKFALEGADQGVWDWDATTGRVLFSERWLSMLGCVPGTVLQAFETWSTRIHPEDEVRVLGMLGAYVEGQVPAYRAEYRLRHEAGHYLWVLDQGMATHRDPGGRPLRLVGSLTEITERKTAEARLLRANEDLARAARLKDEFLALVSHELRTPLTGILFASELILGQACGPLTPRQAKYLRSIEDSGKHLLEIINDILDLARIESGRVQLVPGECNVDELCEASLRLVSEIAGRKGQNLERRVNPPGMKIHADGLRLRQALVNLLGNAVKFTGEGGRITLRAEGDVARGRLRLMVRDTGIGIPADQIGKLFRPFVQVDSTLSRAYGGTGLGLALVRQLVELHGGTVDVTSRVGEGSEFTIDLPWVATPPVPVQAPAQSSESPASVRSRHAGIRVLLVEDNPINVEMISDFLLGEGYRVDVAGDGLEGLRRIEELRPDVVLMDLQMPVLDGLSATRRLRSHPDEGFRRIPVIALTALAMTGDRERSLEAGCDLYLTKPIRLTELARQLERLAGSPRPK
jgi:PAS domain S-box-containing protein